MKPLPTMRCSHKGCAATFSHARLSSLPILAKADGWVDVWTYPRCPAHAVTADTTPVAFVERESVATAALRHYAQHPHTDPAAAATARAMLAEWRASAEKRVAA